MEPNLRQVQEMARRDAILAGNEAVWRQWHKEWFDEIYAFVMWRCAGDSHLAEDVTQETWCLAVTKIRDFDPLRGSFGQWMRGIAINVLRNHRRKGRKRSQDVPLDADGEPVDQTNANREDLEQLLTALGDLPDRFERVLREKYLDGQSVHQIAVSWGVTEKAVESLLGRARKLLREKMQMEQTEQNHHDGLQ